MTTHGLIYDKPGHGRTGTMDRSGTKRPRFTPRDLTDPLLLVRPVAWPYALAALGFATLGVLLATSGMGADQTWRWWPALICIGLAMLFASVTVSKPVMAVDQVGVRMRIGRTWVGAKWPDIDSIDVFTPRLTSAGRVAINLKDPSGFVAGMSDPLRRRTDVNRRLTGTSLAVAYGAGMRPDTADLIAALRGAVPAGQGCPVEVKD